MTASRLTTTGSVFTFQTTNPKDAQKAKDAGFYWNAGRRIWFTSRLQVAAILREFADSNALKEIKRYLILVSPWDLPLPTPRPGIELLPHQLDAVRFALERNRCYLGLDPGLGKTLCAAMIASVVCDRTIYVSPPFLVENIKAEMAKWAPALKVATYHPKAPISHYAHADVFIIPDSFLTRDDIPAAIESVGTFEERTMVVDEAHRFMRKESKRTKVLFGKHLTPGLVDLCERTVYMSGTPMPNRPIELYPVLAKAAPETIDFKTEFQYGVKYCAGYKSRFGWDFSGASNVKELGERVKAPTGPFMLRVRKDVLKLPPKIEEVFVLSGKQTKELSTVEEMLKKKYSTADDLIKAKLKAEGEGEDLHVASYRRMLGEQKARAIIPYIESLLSETKEKIIIFAYHRAAIEILAEGLSEHFPLIITGKTPKVERQKRVRDFQETTRFRLMLGNYSAMGIGLTLTAAHREIFVEFDWVPGVNDQASDRAHRIGQTKSVLVQYVVYRNSLDQSVLEALHRKRKAINLV